MQGTNSAFIRIAIDCRQFRFIAAILGNILYLDQPVGTPVGRQWPHPDGQILDEVYVWGSFTQSKMYMNDVRCGDCR